MKFEFENYIKLLSLLISLFLGIVLTYLITFSYYYAHEIGHVVFGSLGNYIQYGNFGKFEFSAWQYQKILFLNLPMPQQTKIIEGTPTLAFLIGGPLTIIFILFLIYKKYGKKDISYRYLFWIFLINEILVNVICGTDNIFGKPLSVCKFIDINIIAVIFLTLVILVIGKLLYPIIKNKVRYFHAKLQKKLLKG